MYNLTIDRSHLMMSMCDLNIHMFNLIIGRYDLTDG
jgi:hypothetical protein